MLRINTLLYFFKYIFFFLLIQFSSHSFGKDKSRKPKSMAYERVYVGSKDYIKGTYYTEVQEVNNQGVLLKVTGIDRNGKEIDTYFNGEKCFKMALLSQSDQRFNFWIRAGIGDLKNTSFPSSILRILYDDLYLKTIKKTNDIVYLIIDDLNYKLRPLGTVFEVVQKGQNVGVQQIFYGAPVNDEERIMPGTRLKDESWGENGIPPEKRAKLIRKLMGWYNNVIGKLLAKKTICYLVKK